MVVLGRHRPLPTKKKIRKMTARVKLIA
jgi:hypothetical protein